jgi:hypothetical protein
MAFETMRQHISIEATRQVKSLVLTRGTGLQCDDDELGGFNLAEAINQLLIHHFNNINSVSRQFIYRITQMFKALIMSNTRLLKNRDYNDYKRSTVCYFLFHSVYRQRYFDYSQADDFFNTKYYRAVVNLLLFVIQCQ